MKKLKVTLGLLFSTFLLAGAAITFLCNKNNQPIEAKADAEINNVFQYVYYSNPGYNNESFNENFNQALLVFKGTAHGLGDATINDAEHLSKIKLNGTDLTNHPGSILIAWGGQNWVRVVYPKTSVAAGEGCTLEVENGFTIGASVCTGFKLVLNSDLKWEFSDYICDTVDTTVTKFTPVLWDSFCFFTLSNYDALTQTNVSGFASSSYLKNIYINDDPSLSLLNAGPSWNTLACAQNIKQFGFNHNALSTTLDNVTCITIPAGTKFPSVSFFDIANGDGFRLYVTTQKAKFVNNAGTWTTVDLAENNALVADKDYTMFTLSDHASTVTGGYAYFPSASNAMPEINGNYRFQFVVNLGALTDKITVRGGGTDNWGSGAKYYIPVNFDNNAYLQFNGNIDWSTSKTYTWKTGVDYLVEIYFIKTSETACKFLFAINGETLWVSAEQDATGITFGNNLSIASSAMDAKTVYSPYADSKANALNRFGTRKLSAGDVAFDDNRDTGACLTKYADAKAFYNTYLTANQKTALANDASYNNLKERLTAWAAANGEVFNASAGTFSAANNTFAIFGEKDNNSVITIVVATSIALIAFGTFFVLKRKQK